MIILTGTAKMVGVMFAGIYPSGRDDILYIGINTFWNPLTVELPELSPR